ncbi:MAG: hypothetical protein JJU11_05440 [Candidatus Sumerlaeia bacterium]|nr:hypothetical protein [Candidatus Sumerlaeia bacterium]
MSIADMAFPDAVRQSGEIMDTRDHGNAKTWVLPDHFPGAYESLPGDARRMNVEELVGAIRGEVAITATHLFWVEAPTFFLRRHVLLELPENEPAKRELLRLYVARNPAYFRWS